MLCYVMREAKRLFPGAPIACVASFGTGAFAPTQAAGGTWGPVMQTLARALEYESPPRCAARIKQRPRPARAVQVRAATRTEEVHRMLSDLLPMLAVPYFRRARYAMLTRYAPALCYAAPSRAPCYAPALCYAMKFQPARARPRARRDLAGHPERAAGHRPQARGRGRQRACRRLRARAAAARARPAAGAARVAGRAARPDSKERLAQQPFVAL